MNEKWKEQWEWFDKFVNEVRLEAERLHDTADILEGRGEMARARQSRKNAAGVMNMAFREIHKN